MTLKIVREPPPNYEEVCARFPTARNAGTYFCYAPYIYVPLGDADLSQALMKHEEKHAERQRLRPSPAVWWRDYLDDRDFRLAEELVAHQVELRHFRVYSAGKRKMALRGIAHRLSSPLYDLGISHYRACQLITGLERPDIDT